MIRLCRLRRRRKRTMRALRIAMTPSGTPTPMPILVSFLEEGDDVAVAVAVIVTECVA